MIPVPRSPFRYPGGKSRLTPRIADAIRRVGDPSKGFTDAFVGGGSVALFLAALYRRAPIVLNDLDPLIASFWRVTVVDPTDLITRVGECVPTVDLFREMRESGPGESETDRAFYALFFNRTTFSGVLRSGPIGGYDQNPEQSRWTVDCRYNAAALVLSIQQIHRLLRGRTIVSELPAWDVPDEGVAYFDPPYFEQGPSLYGVSMTPSDHDRLAAVLAERRNSWVLSYDDHPEVRRRYAWATITTIQTRYSVTGTARTSWNRKTELLISTSPLEELCSHQMNLIGM